LATLAIAADALQPFQNYIIPGGYAVAGVGLRGTGVLDTATQSFILQNASASLSLTTYADHFAAGQVKVTVPAQADVIAAYLYWETIEKTSTPSSFLGTFAGQLIIPYAMSDYATTFATLALDGVLALMG